MQSSGGYFQSWLSALVNIRETITDMVYVEDKSLKSFFAFDVLLLGIYLKGLTTIAAHAGKRDGPFWMECMSKTLSPAWRRLPSS